jgi:hypothetical protein
MVNYGSNTTDSSASLLRRKAIRKVDRYRKPWVMDSSQLVALYVPITLPVVNKSSALPDVKNALRRMRNSGSRFKLK